MYVSIMLHTHDDCKGVMEEESRSHFCSVVMQTKFSSYGLNGKKTLRHHRCSMVGQSLLFGIPRLLSNTHFPFPRRATWPSFSNLLRVAIDCGGHVIWQQEILPLSVSSALVYVPPASDMTLGFFRPLLQNSSESYDKMRPQINRSPRSCANRIGAGRPGTC